jgi:hypothetical protein
MPFRANFAGSSAPMLSSLLRSLQLNEAALRDVSARMQADLADAG